MNTPRPHQSIFKSAVFRGSAAGCVAGMIGWPVLVVGLIAGLWTLDAVLAQISPAHHPAEFAPLGFLLTVAFAIVSAPVGGVLGAALGALGVLLVKKVQARRRAAQARSREAVT